MFSHAVSEIISSVSYYGLVAAMVMFDEDWHTGDLAQSTVVSVSAFDHLRRGSDRDEPTVRSGATGLRLPWQHVIVLT
jgi:hypothetical protein